ncbi:hypothetical protein DF186_17850, partial [Enterococcus hirae]
QVADFLDTDAKGALIAIGWLPDDDGGDSVGEMGGYGRSLRLVSDGYQQAELVLGPALDDEDAA